VLLRELTPQCSVGSGAKAQAVQMRDARAQIHKSHYKLFHPMYAKLLADVELGAGRVEAAFDLVNKAISEAVQTGQSWFDAELYRARGELLLQCGRPETTASGAAFKHAIDVTRRQRTRAFELREPAHRRRRRLRDRARALFRKMASSPNTGTSSKMRRPRRNRQRAADVR
jgi:predicted ATPase